MALNSVQAILQAYANRDQAAEDAIFSVLDPLSDPTFEGISGDLLDKIGAIAGEPRGGRLDADYRPAIRIRIRVNRSRGKAEDVVQVAILASTNSTPKYSEPAELVAAFEVVALNLPGATQVARLLAKTKAAGTRGRLVYSTNATPVLSFADAGNLAGTTSAQKFGDATNIAGAPSVFASAAVLSPST